MSSTTTKQINLTERLTAARLKGRAEHAAGEVAKVGNLRAGSSGILNTEGEVAGQCVRKAHLRQLGIEIDPPDGQKLIMFELGIANESVVADQLRSTLGPGEVLLQEEEIPIEWLTTNGTKVTGRPDIVICRQDAGALKNVPILGIELKTVHSVWTARTVLFKQTPSTSNLVQAAHYMWKLGNIPYRLMYKGYGQLGQGMSWARQMAAMFPAKGEPLSEYLKYNDKGIPLEIGQFEIVYELEFDSTGRLQYRLESGDGVWKPTLITTQDLERYFEYVSKMATEKLLGPRPLTVDPHGEKLNYTECKYCPLQATCDSSESSGYDSWLVAVRKVVEK